jgi:hypothetical protein
MVVVQRKKLVTFGLDVSELSCACFVSISIGSDLLKERDEMTDRVIVHLQSIQLESDLKGGA